MHLLDTNICIYLMKNKYSSLTEKVLSLDPESLYISAITVFELEYGAAKSKWGEKTMEKLHTFFSPFTIVPFTSEDALEAGRIRAFLAAKGTPIGAYDVLIAAQARTRDMILVTHNTGEFMRVPLLKLEDWVVIS